MEEAERSKIEDMKKQLYDKNEKTMIHKREGVLHQTHYNVPTSWSDEINKDKIMAKHKKLKSSFFKKFFIFSIIFFIGALGFAYYKFSNNETSVSSDKIDIEVIGNSFTKGGEELPLQIEIDNNNSASLEYANLIVEYPKGAEDSSTDVVRLSKDSIGTIAAGEKVVRNIKVTLYGAEKSIRNIKISLEYHPEGSNAIFTKEKYYPVTISVAPLSLTVEAPDDTISNQAISIKVKAVLNTSLSDEENPILQITYPSNFIFESATPVPLVGNSTWDLSSISLTNPITVEVKGRLLGQEGDEQIFHAYAGTSSETDPSEVNIIYSSTLQKISIAKPFLDTEILVNDKDETEYAVAGGSTVNVDINWSNNLSTLITDGKIIASISGNVFDKTKISSNNGYYDSTNNQIVWDRNTLSSLAEIDPGQSGTVSFSFIPISLAGSSSAIKEPQVSIKVSISGKQPQLGSIYTDISNYSEKVIKLLSDFQIATSASYLDGENPPKAESQTRYKINWTLSNSTNAITGAKAVSSLPIYVDWVGIYSDETEDITYNEVTREITWNIGQVSSNTGINSNREASFILSIKPSLSQVGSSPQLIKGVTLTGTDSFTGTSLEDTTSALSILNAGSDKVISY